MNTANLNRIAAEDANDTSLELAGDTVAEMAASGAVLRGLTGDDAEVYIERFVSVVEWGGK